MDAQPKALQKMHWRGRWTNMTYLTLLLRSWPVIGVAILLSVIGWQHIRSLNDALEIADLKAQSRLETVARESAVREVKSRSDWTLKEINREHSKLVAQAQKTAVANFKRRYPDLNRSALGSGVCSPPVFGLRLPAANPDSDTADRPKGADGPAEGIMAPNSELLERFATECALDALHLQQFQRWITLNNFPIEP